MTTDQTACNCGTEDPKSARHGHSHLAWCSALKPTTDQTARIAEELRRLARQDYNNGPYLPPLSAFNLLKDAADLLTAQQAALEAAKRAYAICELHTPDVWEGDGTCVICEAVRLADNRESWQQGIETLTRERDELQADIAAIIGPEEYRRRGEAQALASERSGQTTVADTKNQPLTPQTDA